MDLTSPVRQRASSGSDFEAQARTVLGRLRAQIIEMTHALGSDPARPQDAARRFHLNKNLTWRIAKFVSEADALVGARHLPGAAGMRIYIGALEQAGAPAPLVRGAAETSLEFDHLVEVHSGDRATFELMLENLGQGAGESLEASRKLAFRANSGIWGIQAKARVTTAIVAPNREDRSRVDIAFFAGFVGLKRLRPSARFQLFRVFDKPSPSQSRAPADIRPLDDTPGGDDLWMRRFCTAPMQGLATRRDGIGVVYELAEGPVGNRGAFNCFFGLLNMGFVRIAPTPPEDPAQFSSVVTLPIETLLFDVFVHRDIEIEAPPVAKVYSRLALAPKDLDEPNDRDLLPIRGDPEPLGTPPAVSTSLVPRYAELVEFACGRLGVALDDLAGYRRTLRFPPMPSNVLIEFRPTGRVAGL